MIYEVDTTIIILIELQENDKVIVKQDKPLIMEVIMVVPKYLTVKGNLKFC